MLKGDRRAEFARLLVLAFARDQEVIAQQLFLCDLIMDDDREALPRDWDELTNLLVEADMLSRSLRAVFDR